MGHIAVAVDAREVWGDEFLVIHGGLSEHKVALGDLVVLQVGSDAWFHPELIGKGPTARSFHCAAAVGSKLYIFGGHMWVKEKKGLQKFNDLWCLDTSTWEWAPLEPAADSPQPSPRDFASLVGLEGGTRLLLFGGLDSHEKRQDDAWLFDAATCTWTELKVSGAKPKARYAHAMTRVDQRVLMFGGESNTGLVNDLWTLRGLGLASEEAPAWIPLDLPGTPPAPRKGHTLASLGWWLVVMGGRTAEISWFRSKTDIFHSDVVVVDRQGTMQWRSPLLNGDSPPAREFHSLTAVLGGRLLLFGGGNGKVIFGDAWWLDTEEDGALLATLSSISDTAALSAASVTERINMPRPTAKDSPASAASAPGKAKAPLQSSPHRPDRQDLGSSRGGPDAAWPTSFPEMDGLYARSEAEGLAQQDELGLHEIAATDGEPWWAGTASPEQVDAFGELRKRLGLPEAAPSSMHDAVEQTAGSSQEVVTLGRELLSQQLGGIDDRDGSRGQTSGEDESAILAARAYFRQLDAQDMRLADMEALLCDYRSLAHAAWRDSMKAQAGNGEQLSAAMQPGRFAHCCASDIRLSDVPVLLEEYHRMAV